MNARSNLKFSGKFRRRTEFIRVACLLFLIGNLFSINAKAQALKEIELYVDCIEYIGNNKYQANFGYYNPNKDEINVPQENSIVKTNKGNAYGHTNFKKGRYYNVFSAEFEFTDNVTWAVLRNGGDPDNPDDYRITSANSNSSHCSGTGDDGLIPIFETIEEGGVLWPELYWLAQQDGAIESNEIFQIDNTISGSEKVLIEVVAFNNTVTETLISELLSLGFEQIPEGNNPLVFTGYIPIMNLEFFNKNPLLKLVKFVRPMYTPMTQGTLKSGLVGTQQDRALRTDLVRNAFDGQVIIDGTGIDIGLISDSYANSIANVTAAETSGDLPPRGTDPESQVQIISDWTGRFGLFGGTDEGNAMAQIIYDIAPGANIKFATGALSAERMAYEIRRLADAGSDIIIDDILHLGEPFEPKGQIAKAVEEVSGSGIHVMSSAGNYKDHSVKGSFKNAPIPASFVEFNTGSMAHDWGNGEILKEVQLYPGVFVLEMQWLDDFFAQGEGAGAQFNLDFWIVTELGNIKYRGYRDNIGEDPIEISAFKVETPTVLNLMITGENIPENLPFQLVILRAPSNPFGWQFSDGNENVFNGTTILGHSAHPSNSAVGAAFFGYTPAYNYQPNSLLEPFSSHSGLSLEGSLVEVAYTAPDAGNNTFFGQDLPEQFDAIDPDDFPNFAGTSAAVPAAAAANALILQSYKEFYNFDKVLPSDLKALVQSTSLNFGDPNSGSGLMQPDKALLSLANPSPELKELIFPEDFDINNAGNEAFNLKIQMYYPILTYDENNNLVLMDGEPVPNLESSGTTFSLRDASLNIVPYDDGSMYKWINLDEYILEVNLFIPEFIGNPTLTIENEPKATGDGGTFVIENILDKPLVEILVKARNESKLFGEEVPYPDFGFDIYIKNESTPETDDWILANGNNPLTSVEMDALSAAVQLVTPVNYHTTVGPYPIKISITNQVTINNLEESYIINGLQDDNLGWGILTIDRLPVSYMAANAGDHPCECVESVYGNPIPFEMVYDFMSGENPPNIDPNNIAWVQNFVDSVHQELLAPDTIFIIAEKGLALSEKGLALSEKGLALSEQQTYIITEKGLALSEKGLALSEKGLALSESQSAIEIGIEVAAPFLVDDEPVSPWLNEKGLALSEAQSFIDAPGNTLYFGEKGLALSEKGLALSEKGLALSEDANGNLKDSINLHFVIEATDTELNENLKSVNFVSGLDVLPDGYYHYIAPGALLNENLLAIPKVVKLKITPRSINLLVNDEFPGESHNFNKVYGEPDPEFLFSVSNETPLGLDDDMGVFGETKLGRISGENVGLYDINTNGLSAGTNYSINSELFNPDDEGAPKLLVSPATLSVDALAASKIYGEFDPVFDFLVTPEVDKSIFINTLTRSDVGSENVGQYTIQLGELSAGDNYTIVFTEAVFTITQAELTVWAISPDYPIYAGDPLPVFDLATDFGFSGFIDRFNDDASTVEFILDPALSPTNPEYFGSAGEYEIIFNYTTSNYSITQIQPVDEPGLVYVNPFDDQHVHPRLDCIEENPYYDPSISDSNDPNAYQYIAHMYYDNPYTTTVFIPIGERNEINPSTTASYYVPNQPEYFYPGLDQGLFEVYFDGNKLIWTLWTGTAAKTAAISSDASEGSARCKQVGSGARMASASSSIEIENELTAFDINQIKGYPNPASDIYFVNLSRDLIDNVNVSMVDIQGKMHDVRMTRNASFNRLEIDLVNLKTGLYLLKLDIDHNQKILKVIKK